MFIFNFPEIKDASVSTQGMKVSEECAEVMKEWADCISLNILGKKADTTSLVIETMDLIHSCETLLRCLGLNDRELENYKNKVIKKNKVRGYYGKED